MELLRGTLAKNDTNSMKSTIDDLSKVSTKVDVTKVCSRDSQCMFIPHDESYSSSLNFVCGGTNSKCTKYEKGSIVLQKDNVNAWVHENDGNVSFIPNDHKTLTSNDTTMHGNFHMTADGRFQYMENISVMQVDYTCPVGLCNPSSGSQGSNGSSRSTPAPQTTPETQMTPANPPANSVSGKGIGNIRRTGGGRGP